ncbi:MAG: histidinol-phosphate transaminase [Taibaiella sp.]|jgi:histidinol-phosphate aminotransferase
MFDLQKLLRKNIRNLQPYSSARSEYTGTGIFLDANENPFGKLNRYPDPGQYLLKQKISEIKGIPPENIFIGNGSDEVIDLIIRIFCTPGIDKILTFTPTYGMYEVAAAINDIELLGLPLNKGFQIDIALLNKALDDEKLKIIFICSPNNPTGNCIDSIEDILERFKGIVVLDEAYIDFAQRPSFINQLNKYPNLIVTQTLSKAWGLAAARIGIAYASVDIMNYLSKAKPPYNVSTLNQDAALQALNNIKTFETNKTMLLQQRILLKKQLAQLPIVKKIYPSDANFLLVETLDALKIYNALLKQNIIVRNRSHVVHNCIRISIGSPEENEQLINAMKQIQP